MGPPMKRPEEWYLQRDSAVFAEVQISRSSVVAARLEVEPAIPHWVRHASA